MIRPEKLIPALSAAVVLGLGLTACTDEKPKQSAPTQAIPSRPAGDLAEQVLGVVCGDPSYYDTPFYEGKECRKGGLDTRQVGVCATGEGTVSILWPPQAAGPAVIGYGVGNVLPPSHTDANQTAYTPCA